MTSSPPLSLTSHLVNTLLSIKPLANFAKSQARRMMIQRAEALGIPWRANTIALECRDSNTPFSSAWDESRDRLSNPDLAYPPYYLTSFHAYDEGNLGWLPALEVESAAQSVHAKLWPELGAAGDGRLRQSYHDYLRQVIPKAPDRILDIGCGAGPSTFALQAAYPQSQVTGLDLSPYFLAVAEYRAQQQSPPSDPPITWIHGLGESTGLPDGSFDLVSLCLVAHELPHRPTHGILAEAHRLLAPGGHFALMDMNPQCEFVQKLPPYVLTLLKSTEPYLDEYFSLDILAALDQAGFGLPQVIHNSPRHRTIVAPRDKK